MTVLLSLGPVLLGYGPPIQANRTRDIRQNGVKYRPTGYTSASRLQQLNELHQKDLRINPLYVHILGLRMRHVLRADMFLALFLIVVFYVLRDP